jgi:ribosomal protein S18 acetylase RimI-like enzyme
MGSGARRRGRSLEIRPAGPDDLDAIDLIERASFDRDRISRRNLARLLKSESAVVLIAESRARVLGYAIVLYRRGARAARLYSIAVAPEARGKGVAAALLRAAETSAIRRGQKRLRLEARASNEGAIRLYESAGFTLSRRLPAYYDDGETALKMHKRIGESPR